MRVNPIRMGNYDYGNNKIKKNPSFGAVLLNKATIKDRATGKPVEVAIIELETEYRELLADLRLKHKNDVSEEEFKNLVEKKRQGIFDSYFKLNKTYISKSMDPFHHTTPAEEREQENYAKMYVQSQRDHLPKTNLTAVEVMDDLVYRSGEKKYKGDFDFMESIAQRVNNGEVQDVNSRLQERRNPDFEHLTSMGEYLKAHTNGKRDTMPMGGYGLLKKEYGEALAYMPESIDSLIYKETGATNSVRQRILMAVEPQANDNYRDLKPDTKVYGMAEIYTDRAMDAVEGMASENLEAEEKRMAAIIEDDKKYEELYNKYLNSEPKDEELRKQIVKFGDDICRKYNISWNDFNLIKDGKKYIYDVPDYKGKKAMEEMGISEEYAIPLKIWKLFSTDSKYEGAEETLLDTICKKARFCGVFADKWVSSAIEKCKDFKAIPDWYNEKLFKEGFIKRERILGIKLK